MHATGTLQQTERELSKAVVTKIKRLWVSSDTSDVKVYSFDHNADLILNILHVLHTMHISFDVLNLFWENSKNVKNRPIHKLSCETFCDRRRYIEVYCATVNIMLRFQMHLHIIRMHLQQF